MGAVVSLARRAARLGDRLVRWARMPRPGPGPRRRFVIVQIDGLSHATLRLALARGLMPATRRLLARGHLRLWRIPVGLPTSTPAFQAALMYGGPVDIPAFEYLDKRSGEYVWFPRPWAAAQVEAVHAEGRRGIMVGGRTYGCVFGGGAEDSVLTFARLVRPTGRWGRFGVRARLGPPLVLVWVTAKTLVLTGYEVVRWTGWAFRDLCLGRPVRSPKRWLVRLVISRWLRELFTLSLTADLYAGVPALYVNFVDYDVPAHALGPEHPGALRALRDVDASIRDIWRVLRRVPELGYDLFILSDHGQTASVPFEAVAGTRSAATVLLDVFRAAARDRQGSAPGRPVGPPARPRAWPLGGAWQRHLAYLEPRSRERHAIWAGDLCIVPAGPNVNIYLTDQKGHVLAEDLEARYPGILDRLSRHPTVGFVLARDAEGPLCYYRGVRFRVPPEPGPTGCPLFDRADRELVVEGLQALMAMPSAGDIVLYGHYAPRGCINYLGERGSHAGPAEEELYGFVLAPAAEAFDFGAVRGPADLYPLFLAYQGAAAPGG